MSSLQSFYNASPVPIQHAMATLAGYKKNKTRYGKIYKKHREWLENFDTLPLEQKLAHQTTALNDFIAYAHENSAFYRSHFSESNLARLKSVSELERLPFLEKEVLRNEIDRIVTVPRKGSLEGRTGGTTGKSLVVRITPEDSMKRMAMLDHFKSRVGFEHRKMRRATFMGKHIVPVNSRKPVFWRYNHASKQMLYSAFHLSESLLSRYVESLNNFKPHAIDGFFSGMLDVANYIERHEIALTFSPLAIFPTSEAVTTEGRNTLERVFGARVFNQYASSEGAPFVTECIFRQLHVEHSTGVFEQIDRDSHEIAVTSFNSHGTPLIRYKIGDAMEFGKAYECECGNAAEIVRSISGRRSDYLLRPDGARINAGVAANLFKGLSNSIKKAQIKQTALDSIEILLEVDESSFSTEHIDLLRKEFLQVFGHDTRLAIHIVAEIAREASGKHRFIKNFLTAAQGNVPRAQDGGPNGA